MEYESEWKREQRLAEENADDFGAVCMAILLIAFLGFLGAFFAWIETH